MSKAEKIIKLFKEIKKMYPQGLTIMAHGADINDFNTKDWNMNVEKGKSGYEYSTIKPKNKDLDGLTLFT